MDTVGRNKETIAKSIRNQLQKDIMVDKLSFKEYLEPFDPDRKFKPAKKPKA